MSVVLQWQFHFVVLHVGFSLLLCRFTFLPLNVVMFFAALQAYTYTVVFNLLRSVKIPVGYCNMNWTAVCMLISCVCLQEHTSSLKNCYAFIGLIISHCSVIGQLCNSLHFICSKYSSIPLIQHPQTRQFPDYQTVHVLT